MPYAIRRRDEQVFVPDPHVPGFSTAELVGNSMGSVHFDLDLCRLDPGAELPGRIHAYEESWYVLEGGGIASAAELSFAVETGSFGLTPVGVPESKRGGDDGMLWLRMRAPQPRVRDPRRGEGPAADWSPSPTLLTPAEDDARSRWTGQFLDSDMGAYGPLAMPGYHGPRIKSIFVRMMVDELLGAEQHTLFMVEFGPSDPSKRFASEHYHPFEEAYYLLQGSAHGILEGEHVEVSAGDVIWTSVNATHGFQTTSDVPLRWIEVQAPKPPNNNGFFFLDDWACLGG